MSSSFFNYMTRPNGIGDKKEYCFKYSAVILRISLCISRREKSFLYSLFYNESRLFNIFIFIL
jgi:hypothetical protein